MHSATMPSIRPWLFILWGLWLAGIWLVVGVFRNRRPLTALVAIGAVAFWWVLARGALAWPVGSRKGWRWGQRPWSMRWGMW